MYIVTIARYQVILDTEIAELIKLEREIADFSFYFVLNLHRLSSKLKHLSHKSEESTKHLLIHCGIGKNNGLIFPTLPRKTHIQQYYTEGPIGHRCGAETSWEEGRSTKKLTTDKCFHTNTTKLTNQT